MQADLLNYYTEKHQLWKESDPKLATYRALVTMSLKLGKGENARNVCNHVLNK